MPGSIPFRTFVVTVFLSALSLCAGDRVSAADPPGHSTAPVISYTLVSTYPHDTGAFTQGLAFYDGYLYEGTGIRGKSELRRVDLETGAVTRRHALPDSLFGEGITLWEESILQLTWRSRAGLIYDRHDFSLTGAFHYATEGWGITHDRRRLIMSDGTAFLYFMDPRTYAVTDKVEVRDRGIPVKNLNELEYVKGLVYANVWQTDRIAAIDPESGFVKGWFDLTDLAGRAGGDRKVKTLNGIAYDEKKDRLYVTGKLWPLLFAIETGPLP